MWPFTNTKSPTAEGPLKPLPTEKAEPILTEEACPASDEPEIQKFLAITGYANERLSIPFIVRAPLLLTSSFIVGFSLGAAHGGPIAAYRYRAENAHRLPATQTGWYLYHKSKNYHSIIGGVKEGVKLGGVLCGWATVFMCCEEVVDRSRGRLFAKGDDDVANGQRDAASTVVAAMSTAGIYSWKRGLDKFTAARTAKVALKYSLLYGIVQDLAASLRRNRPAYIDWALRKTFGVRSTVEI
jgi:hypothetical protein